jgi:MFS transporter, SHS family, lactate transporter
MVLLLAASTVPHDTQEFVATCYKIGSFAWSWDAFDFHCATLSYPDLTKEFGRTQQDMTFAITFALMCRPPGGAFGILADKYGRNWPFVANCALLIILVLATGFYRTCNF